MKPHFGGFLRCTARWRMPMDGGFCDVPHVGAYRWMAVFSMGDVDGWQEVFMQNYSCGDCFEVMAFRYFFYDLSFN